MDPAKPGLLIFYPPVKDLHAIGANVREVLNETTFTFRTPAFRCAYRATPFTCCASGCAGFSARAASACVRAAAGRPTLISQ